MDKKMLKEILSAHADRLAQGQPMHSRDYLDLLPDSEGELAPLLNVAEKVQSILRPVAPTGQFEAQLKRDLMAAAHLHQAEGYSPPNPFQSLLILAGIFAFIISLASLLVALRLRRQALQNSIPQETDYAAAV